MEEVIIKKLKVILKLIEGGDVNPNIVFAQFKELITKVPLLYSILLVNSLSLAYTHYGVAPDYLTLYIAAILALVCIARGIRWYGYRNNEFTLRQAIHQIRMTVFFAGLMGIAFSIWAYTLYSYGGVELRAHVAYFMSITAIGVIVCLIHLPAATWAIGLTVGIPFISFFVYTGHPIFLAIANNFGLVLVALVMITRSYYRAFSSVIDANQQLEQQHLNTKKLNEQNELLANQDGLTKLANRRSFANYLNDKLSKKQIKQSFIVGLIDLDGFKPVNDIHGHAAGDRVLTEVSTRLRELFCANSMIARIGGDEFAFVMEHDADYSKIKQLGQKITETLQLPFQMRTGLVQISGSCGFAIYPEAGHSAEELMDRADFALYEAKNSARGSSIIFSEEHESLIRKKSEVELALTQSIKQEQICIHYQPIVDGQTGEILGFESLARWFHPELGKIPPDQFIMIAEKNGMITQITLHLFELAIQNLKQWPEPLYLSFNLSANDVINRATLAKLTGILDKHHVQANRVQFEITETTMMADLEQCSHITREMQKQGFLVALDDFGSGYSSLSYLHKLAFDTLKIDRSFVNNIQQNQRSRGVIKTILELCSSFEVQCTAEGVETAAQRDLLLELGCKNMQGYYFYRPAAIESFELTSQ
ncbi:EAL domain-containing protein [Paraglaciecola aquimarina]|uniref:EAL domain-containing protein n=1 Tax=Paraglaciecola aquimarina TaxID=1235557 RepID=A0ABU3SSV1_9ALTE|nr:EAL domain-containing protein [Paraglaciecola aquimarina]MDU0353093.1 EAL domain-containing protein [Paraglaciecola aquimarina]